MRVLRMRLEAPLMSFGGTVIDNYGVTREFPSLSMVTGLLANALGWDRSEAAAHGRLQDRIRMGVTQDRVGERLEDYQTVDLGQSFLVGTGWTTRGEVAERGGASSEGTHIRFRSYLCDASYTVALRLEPADESPTVEELLAALHEPARPLFIGRKPCLPSGPIGLDVVEVSDLGVALASAPREVHGDAAKVLGQWSDGEGEGRAVRLTDERDWANQIHVGQRIVREGWIPLGGKP